jgi:hypothetical protein
MVSGGYVISGSVTVEKIRPEWLCYTMEYFSARGSLKNLYGIVGIPKRRRFIPFPWHWKYFSANLPNYG